METKPQPANYCDLVILQKHCIEHAWMQIQLTGKHEPKSFALLTFSHHMYQATLDNHSQQVPAG